MSAIWGTWIGTALGYFFGNRPVDALIHNMMRLNEDRLRDLQEQKKKSDEERDNIALAAGDYEEQLIEASGELEDLKSKYERAKKEIVDIVKAYEQHLDKTLLERLKKEYVD